MGESSRRADATPGRAGGAARLGAVSLCAALLIGAFPAWAQVDDPDLESQNPIARTHLPTDDWAAHRLRALDTAVESRAWVSAAEIVDELLQKAGDRLLDGRAEPCRRVADLVAARHRTWSAEFRALLRERWQAPAQTGYEKASAEGDPEALRRIAERYPGTDGAHRAWNDLGAQSLAEGRPYEALSYFVHGKNSEVREIGPVARTGKASAEAAAREGEATAAARIAARLDQWETLGGDPTRSRPMRPDVGLAEKQWTAGIPLGATPGTFAREFVRESHPPTGEETYTPCFPVVADGVIYLHNDVQVFAHELLSAQSEGNRLWAWPVPQRMPTSEVIFEPNAVHTATVADGRLFVNLVWTRSEAERQLDWLDVKLPLPNRALLALDARTGQLLWRVGGARAGESSGDFADRASIACAPAVVGSDLFVGATYVSAATAPIEHSVCKIDAATGALRWRAEVCAGYLEMNLFNNPVRESVGTPVTVHRDLALYCTNMGVTVAVETRTGRVRWARRYRQFPIGTTQDIHAEQMPVSWANNPIVVHGDRMFVAPTDSPYLYAYDPETGRVLWRYVRNESDRQRAAGYQERFVLGLLGELLILSGDTVVAIDVADGKRCWTWRPEGPKSRIVGRGACTREHVYIPTRAGLVRLAVDGTVHSQVGWFGRDAGNLLLVDGVLLSATPTQLMAFYSEEAMARETSEALARAPDDPRHLLRHGKGLVRAKRWEEGAEALRRAAQEGEKRGDADSLRVAGEARWRRGDLFCQRGKEAWERGDREGARTEFARAREAVRDPTRMAEWSFREADLWRMADRPKEAIELYQEALERWGDAPYQGGLVRDHAAGRIREVVERSGRGAYASVEERAGALLAAAGSQGGVEPLDRVTRQFPNSRAAERALLRIAEIHFGAGRFAEALAAATDLCGRRDSPSLPEAFRLRVLCQEQRGAFGTARCFLSMMMRHFPDAPLGSGAGATTVRRFAEERFARPEYQQAAGVRPHELGSPLRLAWTWQDARSTDLCLLTPSGPMPSVAQDLVFAASRGTVCALRRLTGEVVWQAKIEKDQRPASCVYFDQTLVLAGLSSVIALSIQDGSELWRVPFDQEMPQNLRIHEALLVLVTSNRANRDIMRVHALDAATGQSVWTHDFRGTPDHWFLGDEFVVIPAGIKDVAILHRESGTQAGRIALPARYVRLIMPDRNRLVAMTSRNVVSCWDVPSGKKRWQAETGLIAPDSLLSRPGLVAFVERVENNLRQPMLVVVDLETGERKVDAKVSDGDFPANGIGIDDRAMHITFRERQARDRIYVSAFSLENGNRMWKTAIEGTGSLQLFNPVLSGPWFLLTAVQLEAGTQRWSPVVQVIRRSDGASMQAILPGSLLQMTPTVTVQNGILAIVHGDRLFAYLGD